MRVGSLFSGIGGLELGLEWAGVGHTVWQVERDPYASSILARHWPDATRFDDVCAVGSGNLQPVDLICGGFPCQDISTAGKGAGLDGARSGLWFEYARIIRELRPRFIVAENVAALVNRGLDRVLGSLAESGYDAIWLPVRASDVGAPHRRERIFIVGWRRLDDADSRGIRCAGASGRARHAALADQGDVADPTCRGAGAVQQRGQKGGTAADGAGLADAERGACDGWKLRTVNRLRRVANEVVSHGESRAIAGNTEPRMGGIVDGLPAGLDRWPARPGEAQHEWEAPRVAQGVPNRAARLRALGNAVVPQVAYVIGKVVLEIAKGA